MQENNRHPVIPLAMQSQLPANLIEAIQPYQAMYTSVMNQLESIIVRSRQVGATARQNDILAQANEIRTQAEAVAGIRRETHGRIQEYPMTPNEAIASQYITGVDPVRRGHQADSEGVFSVQHRRQDGTWEQVFSERLAEQWAESTIEQERRLDRGRTVHEMMEEMLMSPAQPRSPRVYVSEEGYRQWQEAISEFDRNFEAGLLWGRTNSIPTGEGIMRQLSEEIERNVWYGSSTPKKTRRDKKRTVSTSIYWEYQPFD